LASPLAQYRSTASSTARRRLLGQLSVLLLPEYGADLLLCVLEPSDSSGIDLCGLDDEVAGLGLYDFADGPLVEREGGLLDLGVPEASGGHECPQSALAGLGAAGEFLGHLGEPLAAGQCPGRLVDQFLGPAPGRLELLGGRPPRAAGKERLHRRENNLHLNLPVRGEILAVAPKVVQQHRLVHFHRGHESPPEVHLNGHLAPMLRQHGLQVRAVGGHRVLEPLAAALSHLGDHVLEALLDLDVDLFLQRFGQVLPCLGQHQALGDDAAENVVHFPGGAYPKRVL